MKQINIILLIAITCLASIAMATRGQEYSKVIKKELPLEAGKWMKVQNKYGNVEVVPWDGNTVSFEVTITVKAKSKEKAAEVMNGVKVNFSTENGNAMAETELEDKNGSWYKGSDGEIKSVDYKVKIPCTAKVDISNKYGQVSLPSLEGEAKVELKYGNLSSGQIGGDMDLELKYGNANLSVLGDMKAEIGYANVRLSEAKNIQLDSKYSKFILGKVLSIKAASKYDKFTIEELQKLDYEGKYSDFSIGEMGEVDIDARYSNFKLGQLNGDLEAELSYGDLVVEGLGPSFTKMDVESSYTDVLVKTAPAKSFSLDLRGSYTGVEYPALQNKSVNKDDSEHNVKGSVGSNPGAKKIKIKCRYGSLKVR